MAKKTPKDTAKNSGGTKFDWKGCIKANIKGKGFGAASKFCKAEKAKA